MREIYALRYVSDSCNVNFYHIRTSRIFLRSCQKILKQCWVTRCVFQNHNSENRIDRTEMCVTMGNEYRIVSMFFPLQSCIYLQL